jgi:hypothetical protein
MWTLLLGRCWTIERRRRHGLCSSAECTLCSQEDEPVDHVLLQCTFSREVWFRALNSYGWGHLVLEPNNRLIDWWVATRKWAPKPRRRAFDSMTIGVTWSLWMQRNDRAFGRPSKDASAVTASFWNLISLWVAIGLVDMSHLVN